MDLAGTPPPRRVPLWSPLKVGRKFLSFNPLGPEGAEAKFWLAQTLEGEEGEGGLGRGSKGGIPRPPTVYGRSNTSLGTCDTRRRIFRDHRVLPISVALHFQAF